MLVPVWRYLWWNFGLWARIYNSFFFLYQLFLLFSFLFRQLRLTEVELEWWKDWLLPWSCKLRQFYVMWQQFAWDTGRCWPFFSWRFSHSQRFEQSSTNLVVKPRILYFVKVNCCMFIKSTKWYVSNSSASVVFTCKSLSMSELCFHIYRKIVLHYSIGGDPSILFVETGFQPVACLT